MLRLIYKLDSTVLSFGLISFTSKKIRPLNIFVLFGYTQVHGDPWKNLIGTWTDSGSSWTGSIPFDDAQWHYGPARLWTTPVNSDQYGKSIYGINILLYIISDTRYSR